MMGGMLRLLGLIWILAFSLAASQGAVGEQMRVSKPAVRDEIIAVIEAQLAAFRSGDIAKAYGYAASEFRRQTPQAAFARLVQKNYPEIWRGTHAEFAIVRDDGERATLVVRVISKTSEASYDYVLFKEKAGWRIGGVLRHEGRPADAL